jgi:hypothetical protein
MGRYSLHELTQIREGHTFKGSAISHFQRKGLKVYLVNSKDELKVESESEEYLYVRALFEDTSNSNMMIGFEVKKVDLAHITTPEAK